MLAGLAMSKLQLAKNINHPPVARKILLQHRHFSTLEKEFRRALMFFSRRQQQSEFSFASLTRRGFCSSGGAEAAHPCGGCSTP
jgi:hypothetical protein